MDGFYHSVQALGIPCKRLHFHHFMRWVHRRLFELTGHAAPLTQLAADLADDIRVLCLDELFISDIGDAMLVGPLLQLLFAQQMVVVITSNQAPEQLYENGFNRARLLAAIADIKSHLVVCNINGHQDHRLQPGAMQSRYWVQQPQQLAKVFNTLTLEDGAHLPLTLGHRSINTLGFRQQVLWCRYQDLCEVPLSSSDFIALCDHSRAILLSDVPKLSDTVRQRAIARGTEDGATQVHTGDRVLPTLSRQDDGVRRFIALVDECYDRQIPLYLSAAVPLEELYASGALSFAFRRTLSRLQEMQFVRFGPA
ncbi:cell division protein ZapE [Oceanisphaera avium]|uniref:cell division protein ZapE n=1 Tax=Oceanisphaera avium TaxID=1903694 RepID=UPI001E4E8795|nr:cell division protein ZapE [Oceanisphaera avium]